MQRTFSSFTVKSVLIFCLNVILMISEAPMGWCTASIPSQSSPLSLMLQQAQQSVVSVYVEKGDPEELDSPDILRHPDQNLALGSGVVVSPKGLILTSYHLVQNANQIEIVLADGRKSTAKILSTHPQLDLAVLKCSPSLTRQLIPIPIGTEAPPQLGETVWAIGQPYGLPQTVTQGIIAAPQRRLSTYPMKLIQTDILLGPGSSGGAVLNQRGELIGIATAVFLEPHTPSRVGFAIGVPLIKMILSTIP